MSSIQEIISAYETVVKVVDSDAKEVENRAYGGYIRATKGKLQEYITEEIIKIAWNNLGGSAARLEINSKKIPISIKKQYIEKIKNETVKNYIFKNIEQYNYGISVDKHVFIDKKFIMGVECKAYTENAMIKRILVDFHLLKTKFPNALCFLFQLESQLGGDYSKLSKTVFCSYSTHSIMSYFENVDLNIFTFLKGERKVDMPIHKQFKPLTMEVVKNAIKMMEHYLSKYI